MSIFIIPGKEDDILVLVSRKLMSVVDDSSMSFETSLYSVGREIPYIAETIKVSLTFKDFDFNVEDYWIQSSADTVKQHLQTMNPVKAQSIADKMLISLFVARRFPRGCPEYWGIHTARKLYELASYKHPSLPLRPAFRALTLNFPFWAGVLPRLAKEISFVIGQ